MLSSSAIRNLTKYASEYDEEEYNYRKKPSKINKQRLIALLRREAEVNPFHLQGGYFKDTKSMLDRAYELEARGNPIRGSLTKYVSVPLTALTETVLSPVRVIGRTVTPGTNLVFSDIDELKDIEDREELIRAARELHRLYNEERPDPTANWEGIRRVARSINATPSEFASDIVTHLAAGGVPIVGDAITDTLSIPHTALFDKMKWNGISREEYLRRKRKNKS
jgi:hypothetical protein